MSCRVGELPADPRNGGSGSRGGLSRGGVVKGVGF